VGEGSCQLSAVSHQLNLAALPAIPWGMENVAVNSIDPLQAGFSLIADS